MDLLTKIEVTVTLLYAVFVACYFIWIISRQQHRIKELEIEKEFQDIYREQLHRDVLKYVRSMEKEWKASPDWWKEA